MATEKNTYILARLTDRAARLGRACVYARLERACVYMYISIFSH